MVERGYIPKNVTYRSTCDDELFLPSGSTHQDPELLTYPFQQAQSVVLRESCQEVFDGVSFVGAAGVFLQFSNDLRLVAVCECGGGEDGAEFLVGLEKLLQ